MPEAAWRRSLTSIASQLRERAALANEAASVLDQEEREETAGANQDRAAHLRKRADTCREAARLLDDAEAMIASLQDSK